jgi:tRNA(fMet)-specific endonuclease VapC
VTHVLDTDHLSILQRPASREHPAVVTNLNLHGIAKAYVSIISFHEQALGCHDHINKARTAAELVRGYALLQQVITSFADLTVLPFDDPAATQFLNLKGKVRIGAMDLRIAATALAHNLTVVTRNVSDFGKVPGLRTEDWTK